MLALARLRAAIGLPTRVRLRRKFAGFLAATQRCHETQQAVLVRLVALNGDSRFSRTHGLTSAAEFRKRMPVVDYEYFRPFFDDVKAGDSSALLG